MSMPLHAQCRPRLYVYQLPEAYRDPYDDGTPRDGVGRPVHARTAAGADLTVWDNEQYSVASLIHERALSYRCRTQDPADADLFLVPAFKSRIGGGAYGCVEQSGKRGPTILW